MSALHPKADMCGATRYVRFVPISGLFRLFTKIDHLVSAGEKRWRNDQAKQPGGLVG